MADLARLFDFSPNTLIKSSEVDAEFSQLIARINDLPPEAFQTAIAERLALSQPGTVRRGFVDVAAEESRTNTAFGTLTTPDVVEDVVMPAGGLIYVAYMAMWRESVNATAAAAIFLNSTEVLGAVDGTAAPTASAVEANVATDAGAYSPLSTSTAGLTGRSGTTATAYTGHVTTGQVVAAEFTAPEGGFCAIFAAPGTYDVSIQFRASSGTVTVKQRKLWVKSEAFL